MKQKVAFWISAAIGLVGSFVVTVASPWLTHSPEVPAEIKK
jgi:cyclic lactone autoinducer peptide